ncbi:MAG: alpha/beta fold hydrolase [Acidimicrobiia bacterium]
MFDVYANTRRVRSGGVEVVVADHGPVDGTPVIMIHGFPDSARLWRHQIPRLCEAGYRVLAPDLRGFGRSDKPTDVAEYTMAKVATDMVVVLDDAGVDKAHVVGHDWGAAIAWYLAIARTEKVQSLTACSVGHPTAFQSAGREQVEKSWYMLMFQFEGIAEQWLSANDWDGMRRWLGPHPEMENWIGGLSRPGALASALAMYRANMGPKRFLSPPLDLPPVRVPVMGLWSTEDVALVETQMTESEEFVAGEWRYERIEGASHWIPLDQPGLVSDLLIDWLDM